MQILWYEFQTNSFAVVNELLIYNLRQQRLIDPFINIHQL